MCVVCGCSDTDPAHARHVQQAGAGLAEPADTPSGLAPRPPLEAPEPPRVDPTHGDLHFGAGVARVSVPGMSPARAIRLEADILGANNRVARHNRAHFAAHGVTALNLVSSPGSGKTTLLCATITALRQRRPGLHVAVIEGDQQTSFDADRIRATGAPAVQVNTGKGCHLDAPMVAQAFAQLHRHAPAPGQAHGHDHGHDHDHDHGHGHGHGHAHGPGGHTPSLLFIENVGNLVCPAVWDLGEAAKVAILSVTEGEDKPLKYPDMFAAAELMVLNKTDLLPHLRFDVDRCIEMARRVNPAITVLQLSASTGEGMDAWLHWLEHAMGLDHHHAHPHPHPHAPAEPAGEAARLRQRIHQLEAELAQARAAQPAP